MQTQGKPSLPGTLCSASFPSIPRCTAEVRPKAILSFLIGTTRSTTRSVLVILIRLYDFLSWHGKSLPTFLEGCTDFIDSFIFAPPSIWVLPVLNAAVRVVSSSLPVLTVGATINTSQLSGKNDKYVSGSVAMHRMCHTKSRFTYMPCGSKKDAESSQQPSAQNQ
jgi:hypothetical protein